MRPKLAVIVGHSKDKSGACSNDGLTEYNYNMGVAHNIWNYSEKYPEVDVELFFRDGKTIKEVANEVNFWTHNIEKSLAVELHCNASDNPSACGTEVLFDPSPISNKIAAKSFQKAIHGLFQIRDRGIKELSQGMRGHYSMSVLQCSSVILEPAFLSCETDVAMLRLKQHEYAEIIMETALKLLGV